MNRRALLLLFAVLALAFAPAPFPKPRKEAKEPPIIGSWNQVGSPTVTLVVTSTTLTYENAGGSPSAYFLTFDPARTPKTYELRRQQGEPRASYSGIYKIEGDTLTLHYGGGENRPASFQASGIKETFKRVR
jgi:uncharacterized protein (TIGR03067 family)